MVSDPRYQTPWKGHLQILKTIYQSNNIRGKDKIENPSDVFLYGKLLNYEAT